MVKIKVISGQHSGKTGRINGDLIERTKTLGRDGKVFVYFDGGHDFGFAPKNMLPIRIKHLMEEMDLFK